MEFPGIMRLLTVQAPNFMRFGWKKTVILKYVLLNSMELLLGASRMETVLMA